MITDHCVRPHIAVMSDLILQWWNKLRLKRLLNKVTTADLQKENVLLYIYSLQMS